MDNLKNDEVRRECQAMIAELYEEDKAKGGVSGTDVERAWKEMKEGIVGAVMKVYGTIRKRNEVKRTRWWNEEVKCAVREKKMLYRKLLDTGMKEAKHMYNKAKLQARKVVQKAKNVEWVQLGKELDKDAKENQQRF